MKKIKIGMRLVAVCVVCAFILPVIVHADMGPKPSVQIKFTGIEGETYYGTLLAKEEATGPAYVWDGTEEGANYLDGEYEIWKKFLEYEDKDGYHFLQWTWECSETNELNWTYYPPNKFKILLYFPEDDTFYVSSDAYERYAFDSYYTVDLSGTNRNKIVAEEDSERNNANVVESDDRNNIVAKESYDYTWESVSLVARIVITILLELAIALLFGYREKKVLSFFAVVNVITQVVLNIALNIINYRSGAMAFVISYILLEMVVFTIEAIVYKILIPRVSEKQQKGGKVIWYALVANVVSFVAGFWLAQRIPGIF